MGHRYYDGRQGRFISQDPIGDGDNWYAYAGNSPTNEVDPDGLMVAPTPEIWSLNGGDQTDMNSVFNMVGEDAQSSFSTWAQTEQLYLVRYKDYHDGTGWHEDAQWPLWTLGSAGMFAADPVGRPQSYEPGVGPNGEKGTWKNYKNGERVFEPDEAPPVKKKGHGDGGRNQGTDEGEHSRNAKGNRTPPSTGGTRRFNPLVTGAGVVGVAGTGYLVYQGVKDIVAILGAPESGGASLLLLAAP